MRRGRADQALAGAAPEGASAHHQRRTAPRGGRLPQLPFYVNTLAQPWIADPARERRRAAVSSFGFGGTNFHCVLEEHDPNGEGLAVLAPAARVHLWHAEEPAALLDLLESDAAPADGTEPVPAGHARLALVASGAEEAAELRAAAARELRTRPEAEEFVLPRGAYYRRTALLGGEGGRAKRLAR
ncbi:hypothetical protein LUW77_28280 [Streptomyces radiopugnans]|nr:hypothetical protein LUW77_28280 [Streptomyces radiopugnans]